MPQAHRRVQMHVSLFWHPLKVVALKHRIDRFFRFRFRQYEFSRQRRCWWWRRRLRPQILSRLNQTHRQLKRASSSFAEQEPWPWNLWTDNNDIFQQRENCARPTKMIMVHGTLERRFESFSFLPCVRRPDRRALLYIRPFDTLNAVRSPSLKIKLWIISLCCLYGSLSRPDLTYLTTAF